MKILHVHDQATFQGGVEQILFDTACGLEAEGWPQALLTLEGPRDPMLCQAFERVTDTVQDAAGFHPDAVLLHKVADADRIEAIARLFPTAHMVHDHDLVCPRKHKYLPIGHAICDRPAGAACYLRLCVVQRSAPGSAFPIRMAGPRQVRRQMHAGQFVRKHLVGSTFMQHELIMNGIDARRISVIHPVPAALRRTQVSPETQQGELLFVGQVIRGKGVDLMLRALAGLRGDWKATIIGDGNQLPECRRLSQQLGLDQQVTFTGWIHHDRLESFYQKASIVVVPSRWPEPFGMVGLEAMARGRAVVAFASGGIGDWLDDGVTGLLAAPGDVNALKFCLQQLLDEPELAALMGQAGARRVKTDFSHCAYLADMRKHLEALQ